MFSFLIFINLYPLLALSLFCSSFSTFLRWKSIAHLRLFLFTMHAFIAISFLLSTLICHSFMFIQFNVFLKFFLETSLTDRLVRSVFLDFQVFGNFHIFLMLISNWIPYNGFWFSPALDDYDLF